ncbi:hypothetical protein BH11CYA1_BH11CYA1_03470 [soil metagenome]
MSKPEEVSISDRNVVPAQADNNGNKLGEQAADLLTSLQKGDKVSQPQLAEALAPALGDAKHHSLAPAAKMMLDEFKLVDGDKDGGATAKEIGDYVQKNAARLADAPKIKDANEPWYEKAWDQTASARQLASSVFGGAAEGAAMAAGIGGAVGKVSDEQAGTAAVKAMLTKDGKAE